jgi:selenium donor protein
VQVLHQLPQFQDANLLVGSATGDDAGIYRLSATRALVQTVDFFTPIVDDPYLYGQIAAANSLSDIYAMGGRPLTAMAVMGIPTDLVPLKIVNRILRGGAEKVIEAKCSLVGGHTIRNPEPFYGLSVTGLVNPKRMITNAGGRPGELLLLTKPLGTGIITTAHKRKIGKPNLIGKAVTVMQHDFKILKYPFLVGLSRKSMICRLLNVKPEDALNGTTALNTIALLKGAKILRVHDVKEAREVVKIVQQLNTNLTQIY